MVLRIYDERWLKLQINTVTGQLHITEADATIASSVEMRLATSSRLANIHTDKLLDVLINTRTMVSIFALRHAYHCCSPSPTVGSSLVMLWKKSFDASNCILYVIWASPRKVRSDLINVTRSLVAETLSTCQNSTHITLPPPVRGNR